MLKCKDFPVEDQTEFLAVSRKYEPIESVLERVNDWIGTKKIKVLNVETIVYFHGLFSSNIGQNFIRLWYEE